jgi:hypothetical protein
MKWIIWGIVVYFLTACSNTNYYKHPVEKNNNALSSIIGSKIDSGNVFLADKITYINIVDGFPVKWMHNKFDKVIYIKPGVHDVRLVNTHGLSSSFVNLQLLMIKGEKYIGKSKIVDVVTVKFWIENSKGNMVTEKLVSGRRRESSPIIL